MAKLATCIDNISSLSLNAFSLQADANQEATKRVVEAVVADHVGSAKCPWSAAEMKGNNNYCASNSLLLGLLTYFRLIHLPSCYRTVCYRTVQ